MREPEYWFPAKQLGWGWGPPHCWQGWVVLIAWMAAVTYTGMRLVADPGLMLLATLGWSGVLVAICYWKGEPPGPSFRDPD
jgi:hypothetical protein